MQKTQATNVRGRARARSLAACAIEICDCRPRGQRGSSTGTIVQVWNCFGHHETEEATACTCRVAVRVWDGVARVAGRIGRACANSVEPQSLDGPERERLAKHVAFFFCTTTPHCSFCPQLCVAVGLPGGQNYAPRIGRPGKLRAGRLTGSGGPCGRSEIMKILGTLRAIAMVLSFESESGHDGRARQFETRVRRRRRRRDLISDEAIRAFPQEF